MASNKVYVLYIVFEAKDGSLSDMNMGQFPTEQEANDAIPEMTQELKEQGYNLTNAYWDVQEETL